MMQGVSLTGWPFLTLLCVGLVALTVVAIGDVRVPRVPRVLRRVVVIVLAQLVAVLTALVAINNWGQFYGSWADLMGGGEARISTVTAMPGQRAGSGVPDTFVLTDWSSRAELPTRGGVFSTTLQGPTSGLATKALVFLPPQYFQSAHANDRFPVVETIAGYPGDVPQLVDHLGYPAALDTALEKKTTRPMILVFMKPTLAPPRDTECTDVPGGPRTLTFFSHDVPMLMKRDLRTTEAGWGAMGHSTGGYCAAKLAMTNPSQFSTAVSLSGYFTAHKDAETGDIYGGDRRVRDESDLIWRLKHLPVPDVAILASVGGDEHGPDGIEGNTEFIRSVKAPMTAELKTIADGGHNFRTYQAVLPDAFAWLGRYLR